MVRNYALTEAIVMDKYNFLELASERFSVRNFKDKEIEQEDLDKILKAGYVAPTAHNLQPQRIMVINTPEGLEKLGLCTRCLYGAKAALLVCYDKEVSWKRKFDGKDSGENDASIVATHMMLEAASIGVGTTWVMYFKPDTLIQEFNIPSNYEPVALLVMGYPADDAKPIDMHSEFQPMDKLVFYNSFEK